jgi:hypothetical protein
LTAGPSKRLSAVVATRLKGQRKRGQKASGSKTVRAFKGLSVMIFLPSLVEDAVAHN